MERRIEGVTLWFRHPITPFRSLRVAAKGEARIFVAKLIGRVAHVIPADAAERGIGAPCETQESRRSLALGTGQAVPLAIADKVGLSVTLVSRLLAEEGIDLARISRRPAAERSRQPARIAGGIRTRSRTACSLRGLTD